MAVDLWLNSDSMSRMTSLSGNIDIDKITPIIYTQQRTKIRTILGINLYNKINNDYINDTLTGVYKEMFEEYIQDMLIYFTMGEYIVLGTPNTSNSGIHKLIPDNAETIDVSETIKIAERWQGLGHTLELQLVQYLKINPVPEYGSCGKKENYGLNWFLPSGTRKPEVVQPYSGGGATGSGATGPTGPAGPQGPQGEQGPTGATGPIGPQGPTGPSGEQGPIGPTGPQGLNGTSGINGINGVTGATGPQGLQGTSGTSGINGINGATGPQGPKGDTGETGQIGATGATGPQGLNGTSGTSGINGQDGATGATGATGPQGIPGPTGPAGGGSGGGLTNSAPINNFPISGTGGNLYRSSVNQSGNSFIVGDVLTPVETNYNFDDGTLTPFITASYSRIDQDLPNLAAWISSNELPRSGSLSLKSQYTESNGYGIESNLYYTNTTGREVNFSFWYRFIAPYSSSINFTVYVNNKSIFNSPVSPSEPAANQWVNLNFDISNNDNVIISFMSGSGGTDLYAFIDDLKITEKISLSSNTISNEFIRISGTNSYNMISNTANISSIPLTLDSKGNLISSDIIKKDDGNYAIGEVFRKEAVIAQGFESGQLAPLTSTSSKPWYISSTVSRGGSYSAAKPVLLNGETSSMFLTITSKTSGFLRYYYYIDDLSNDFDNYLELYVNGVRQSRDGSSGNSWSQNNYYTQENTYYEFEWRAINEGSTSKPMYIDDLVVIQSQGYIGKSLDVSALNVQSTSNGTTTINGGVITTNEIRPYLVNVVGIGNNGIVVNNVNSISSALDINTTNSARGILINNTTTATGIPLEVRKNGVTNAQILDSGLVKGTSLATTADAPISGTTPGQEGQIIAKGNYLYYCSGLIPNVVFQTSFESGSLSPLTSTRWTISTDNPRTGTYSARVINAAGSGNSNLLYNTTLSAPSTLDFYLNSSYEFEGLNYFRVLVNNVQVYEQTVNTSGYELVSIPLNAGTNNIQFRYARNFGGYNDIIYIDDISISSFTGNWKRLAETDIVKSGLSSFDSDGVSTVYMIPHNMGGTPKTVIVTRASADDYSLFATTFDSTNIILTYSTPPTAGEIPLNWLATI